MKHDKEHIEWALESAHKSFEESMAAIQKRCNELGVTIQREAARTWTTPVEKAAGVNHEVAWFAANLESLMNNAIRYARDIEVSVARLEMLKRKD
jgi:hypothetical protein